MFWEKKNLLLLAVSKSRLHDVNWKFAVFEKDQQMHLKKDLVYHDIIYWIAVIVFGQISDTLLRIIQRENIIQECT